MHNIIYSTDAICSMVFDCSSIIQNIETGGVLVGPRNYKKVVTDIIPSSVYAERKATTYCQNENDVEILNNQLREFQSRGYDFKGYYHRHPSGLFNLSHGDKIACLEILKDPNYKINNYLIMCIVTKSNYQSSPVFSYAVWLNSKNEIKVKKTGIKILPITCIQEFVDCFEPDIREDEDEGIHNRQCIRAIEEYKTGRVIRHSNKSRNNNKLS